MGAWSLGHWTTEVPKWLLLCACVRHLESKFKPDSSEDMKAYLSWQQDRQYFNEQFISLTYSSNIWTYNLWASICILILSPQILGWACFTADLTLKWWWRVGGGSGGEADFWRLRAHCSICLQLCVQCPNVGSLKLAMVGVFTSWKWQMLWNSLELIIILF